MMLWEGGWDSNRCIINCLGVGTEKDILNLIDSCRRELCNDILT
jgi:hypothetical protein